MGMGANFAIPALASILILGGFGLTQQAFALPTSFPHTDDPDNCDFLFIDRFVDELGLPPSLGGAFPPDESIRVVDRSISPIPACPGSVSPPGPGTSVLVDITNTVFPPRAFFEVWYVADRETSLTNHDGFVFDNPAFRIDAFGANKPLFLNHLLLMEFLSQVKLGHLL